MDHHQDHSQNPPMGVGGGGAQFTYGYGSNPYQNQPNQVTGSPGMVVPPMGTIQPTGQPAGAQMGQDQLAFQHIHQQHQLQLQQRLQAFWANQYQEIERVTDFKNHCIPLTRIKKIMKADEDVRMIAAEAPVLFAKACEMFVTELTLRSWSHAEENRRRTLQKNDVAAALRSTDIFDFLLDIVSREDLKDEALPGGAMPIPGPADSIPYCYVPPQHAAPQVGTSGVIMDPSIHAQQLHPYVAPQVGTSGVIMDNLAMDPNVHAQQLHPYVAPQVGTAGVIMDNPAMDPNMHAQQLHPYMAPQVGTAGVIMDNPAMDPNMHAQQLHPYMAPQVGTAGVIMDNPAIDPNIYAQQPHPYMAPQTWPQPPEQQQSPPDH